MGLIVTLHLQNSVQCSICYCYAECCDTFWWLLTIEQVASGKSSLLLKLLK